MIPREAANSRYHKGSFGWALKWRLRISFPDTKLCTWKNENIVMKHSINCVDSLTSEDHKKASPNR